MAAVFTLGLGGPMGLEGPSMYGGSALGAMIQRRLPAAFKGADHRTLLVAGAAAGVSAIFKAPATGAIFALEVPFRDQMARRMLLPALVASASGYLVFAALSSTRPIFLFDDNRRAEFAYKDLLGAVLVGIACAVGARGFAFLIRKAKASTVRPIAVRLPIAAAVSVVLFVITRLLTGESLTLGSYPTIVWLGKDNAIWLLAAVFAIRCVATATITAGGGVGGLFIPLVVGGALVGRAGGRDRQPVRSDVVRDPRDGRVPRCRLSRSARGGGLRCRDDGTARFHRAGPVRRRRRRTRDGGAVDHLVPAAVRTRRMTGPAARPVGWLLR